MEFIKNKSCKQSLWTMDGKYYLISTSLDSSEVMIFSADEHGSVTDYMDLYVSYENVFDHASHAKDFIP
jgi:hypothetical protein